MLEIYLYQDNVPKWKRYLPLDTIKKLHPFENWLNFTCNFRT